MALESDKILTVLAGHENRHQNRGFAVLCLIFGKVWLNLSVEGATTDTPGGRPPLPRRPCATDNVDFLAPFQLGPGWGRERTSPTVTTVTLKSENLGGLVLLEPRGHDKLPPAASQPSRPSRPGVPLRLPPALGPNDAVARGQLGPAP